MKPVFSFSEIRGIEKQIIENEYFPSIVLMENAGKNSFDIILNQFPDLSEFHIYIFCGKGNNAGDGYTLARHLEINNIEFKIVPIEEPSSLKGDALINYQALVKCLDKNDVFENIEEFEKSLKHFSRGTKFMLIDAVLGTGINGELSLKYLQAIELINHTKENFRKSKIVSLDIPSGLMSGKQINPLINADITISMGTMKTELLFGAGKDYSGDVFIAHIGITGSLIKKYDSFGKSWVELSDVQKLFPKRKKTSHKYSNGKLLVIGGSKGLTGAVIMSSLAAIKSGAGGVTAAIPASLSAMIGKKHFDVMRLELDENSDGSIKGNSFEKLAKRMNWADAVLLGPGISTNDDTAKFVFDVVRNSDKNLVIDADALTLIANEPAILAQRKLNTKVILTPHIGEFSRLSGLNVEEIQLNRFEAVREFAAKYKVNVVLKSETSISCNEHGKIFVNSTGNQSLAEAGTGDVLSGIMASLLAQLKDTDAAMICGNYLHGMCANMYFDEKGNKQSASPLDILKFIPKAVTRLIPA